MSDALDKEDFSAVELDIIRMIVGVMSDKEIAFALDKPAEEITVAVCDILSKIGTNDRSVVVFQAVSFGWVPTDL